MYVDPIYTYGSGNIMSFKECVCYGYKIKPINSLYASDTQLGTLIENLYEKILSVNMPGAIYILPKRVNEKEILSYYEALYKENGKPELDKLKKSVMKDLKSQLCEKVRYRYQIYMIFSDNRDPLKKKMFADILKKNNDKLDKRMVDLCEIVDEQIMKKLSSNLSVEKMTKEMTQEFLNYLAMPVEGTVSDYYTIPHATELEYEYKYIRQSAFKTVYSRTLIAEKVKYNKREDALKANTVINRIQEYSYPVDTIIKFDLEHTQMFKRAMSGKREDIRKSKNRYIRLADRRDKDAEKAFELAKIGENVDASIEDSKIRWQMLFRIRANDQEMLTKRSDNIKKKFEGKGVPLTYAIGEQEKLANHLFPYKTSYNHYLNLTDVLYFAHFNFLGGLYIGEEDTGIVSSYTNPADLPVRVDLEAPIKGRAKIASSTTIYAGETGAGKSQIANNTSLMSMIFYGHKLLVIDPKGDRKKLIALLNSFGDITSHLIIGDKDCPSGMFDAFLLHHDDQTQALSVAKNDIMMLARAVNKAQEINLLSVDKAYRKMCIAKQEGRIKRLTMSHLVDYLMEYDPTLASNVLSLREDPMARLFFGNDDTDLSSVFRLDKPYNLVTFAKMPVYSEEGRKIAFNEKDLTHNIFALVLSKTEEITNMFIRIEKGRAKTLLIDEAKLWATVPGGMSILVNNNLIARSELCNMIIILQNWSDLPDSIIGNTGQFFIGNMASKKEIKLILEHFDLGNNSVLSSILADRTKVEGVDTKKQFNFLYCDYNNRKCITKLKFLDTFAEAFRTFKSAKDVTRKKVEITNGDDPV